MQDGAERRGVTGKLGGDPMIKHLQQLGGQGRRHGLLLTKTIQKVWRAAARPPGESAGSRQPPGGDRRACHSSSTDQTDLDGSRGQPLPRPAEARTHAGTRRSRGAVGYWAMTIPSC